MATLSFVLLFPELQDHLTFFFSFFFFEINLLLRKQNIAFLFAKNVAFDDLLIICSQENSQVKLTGSAAGKTKSQHHKMHLTRSHGRGEHK